MRAICPAHPTIFDLIILIIHVLGEESCILNVPHTIENVQHNISTMNQSLPQTEGY
jgi:hypothetical protein